MLRKKHLFHVTSHFLGNRGYPQQTNQLTNSGFECDQCPDEALLLPKFSLLDSK